MSVNPIMDSIVLLETKIQPRGLVRPSRQSTARRSDPSVAIGSIQSGVNASRAGNRDFPRPECGAEVGRVCRYPSGYRYERGHSKRGPRG